MALQLIISVLLFVCGDTNAFIGGIGVIVILMFYFSQLSLSHRTLMHLNCIFLYFLMYFISLTIEPIQQ